MYMTPPINLFAPNNINYQSLRTYFVMTRNTTTNRETTVIASSRSLFTPNKINFHPEIVVVSSVDGTVYCSYYGTHTFQQVAETKEAAIVSWQRCASVCG